MGSLKKTPDCAGACRFSLTRCGIGQDATVRRLHQDRWGFYTPTPPWSICEKMKRNFKAVCHNRNQIDGKPLWADQILTQSLATSLRCGWCLLDLTRVKSGRACSQPRHGRGVLR